MPWPRLVFRCLRGWRLTLVSSSRAGVNTIVSHATCLGCGCACDDIDVVVRDGRIAEARNACALGIAWFGDGLVPALTRVDGAAVSMDVALDAAAGLLARAERPLVYLAPEISCETQREGTALADALHATVDSVTSATVMRSVLAAQETGRAGATLGEIRNRADVVVFWGVDPALRYPRYSTRYAPEPAGLHVPEGRRSRTVVAVDIDRWRGPADADLRVAIPARQEVATLTALRAAIAAGPSSRLVASRPEDGSETTDERSGTVSLETVVRRGRYVVFVADAEPDDDVAGERDPGRAAALIALTQALNDPTRCALSILRGGGNRSGADAVSTWQTGYPAAVDFSRGFPRYRPHDGTAAARLSRGEVDVLVVIGSVAATGAAGLPSTPGVPVVVIGPRASAGPLAGAAVVIDTGVAGVHEGGTAMRMDDVALPLRPSVAGPPATVNIVAALRGRIVAALAANHPA